MKRNACPPTVSIFEDKEIDKTSKIITNFFPKSLKRGEGMVIIGTSDTGKNYYGLRKRNKLSFNKKSGGYP